MSKPKIIVIVGQTASGKSDLAVQIAKKYNGEIISADSRQVYKGLNIGTGKITKPEMQGIPHHLLDILSPQKIFTAQNFKIKANKAIQNIIKKNKLPIIAGGTAFYIDTLLYNISLPKIKANPKLRKELSQKTTTKLFKILKQKDKERSKTIDPNNPHRLIRALEIIEATNQPIPKTTKKEKYNSLKIGIQINQENLIKNINQRLNKRIKQGLIKEVQNLHNKSLPAGRQGLSYKRMEELGLEYKYIAKFLKKEMTEQEMIKKLQTEIYKFAKRQMTWWKKDKDIHWIKTQKEAEKMIKKF